MGGFCAGVYMGFMGGVVFSIAVALLVLVSGAYLKSKEKGLTITVTGVHPGADRTPAEVENEKI